MIGPLLNICSKFDGILKKYDRTVKLSGTYGYGLTDVVVKGDMTNEQLFNKYGTLEFHNLTIEEGAVLKPKATLGAGYEGNAATKNAFHPLILKCSGTLTVNGTITAGYAGSKWYFWDGADVISENICDIPVPTLGGRNWGFSVSTETYGRLSTLGATRTFLNTDFFFAGGSGGGTHRYRKRAGGHHHGEKSCNKGINYGGGRDNGKHNARGGSAGGFLCLYYNNLNIDGRIYGIDDDCDISKIASDGIDYSGSENERSGGCMVIAARNIVIGKNGSINATANNGVGKRHCFLNNPPQLRAGQTGILLDYKGDMLYGSPSNSTYYYYTKPGGMIHSVVGSLDQMHGGAGLALGYRVIE